MYTIDNALPENQFEKLYEKLELKHFWTFCSSVSKSTEEQLNDINQYYFVHDLLLSGSSKETIDILNSSLKNHFDFYPKTTKRCRYLLYTNVGKNVENGFHKDSHEKDYYTCLLYLNDCNGYTEIKKHNLKINSVKNRLLLFRSNLEHQSVTQTDTKARFVIHYVFK